MKTLPLVVTCLFIAGCTVGELPSAGPDTNRDTSTDTADDDDGSGLPDVGGGYTVCDARADDFGASDCPDGTFCETTAFICVDCVARTERCTDDNRREICLPPVATGVGELVSGGFFERDDCENNLVCVPEAGSATDVECLPEVCDANESTCFRGRVKQCNATGTQEEIIRCTPGRACYQGACQPIRHNVLVLFDTSGSMMKYHASEFAGLDLAQCGPQAGPCLDGFPACEPADDPITLFGLAKVLFTTVVEDAVGSFAQFALQAFPQKEALGTLSPNCSAGFYASSLTMTDDDDSRQTEAGGWFDDNRGESILVPFPTRADASNTDDITEWTDFKETVKATDTACTVDADCQSGGCGTFDGASVCFTHANNELRANSATPLGKSLFYAGEYFRRFVQVDGKVCERDLDCASTGYVCADNRCIDPYRECRDNFIIVFTDGLETTYGTTTEFFNPAVQAKRLAYGLDCVVHEDCRGGATCQSGQCLLPGGSTEIPVGVSGGFNALGAADGSPVSIRTSVIGLSVGAPTDKSQDIAVEGGGVFFAGTTDAPEDIQAQLLAFMSPDFKCTPEDIDALFEDEPEPQP